MSNTTTTEEIRAAIAAARRQFAQLSPEEAFRKPSGEVWSKNEVLGHLIDSAVNNHQRIVRAALNAALDFPLSYHQEHWVAVQGYGQMSWNDLLELFVLYNQHLCRVIDALPSETMNNLCNIGRDAPVTLKFVIDDYLRHLKVHIAQVLELTDY